MTEEQLMAEYIKDFDYVCQKLYYLYKKMQRAALKKNVFPWKHTFDGTTPRGNRYFTIIQFKNRRQVKRLFAANVSIITQMVTSKGTAYIEGEGMAVNAPMTKLYVYTPHLIERYKSRCGFKEGYDDIVKQFFDRTQSFAARMVEDDTHGHRYEAVAIIDDGMLLGTSDDAKVVVWRTFMNDAMLNNGQKDKITRDAEELLAMYDDMKAKQKQHISETTAELRLCQQLGLKL